MEIAVDEILEMLAAGLTEVVWLGGEIVKDMIIKK